VGLFSKKPNHNAQEVRQMMEPFLEMVKNIEYAANEIDQSSNGWIEKTQEVVSLIYVFTATTTMEAKRMIALVAEGKISPAANQAAIQTFNLLTDQTDSRMALITQSLIDSGMSYTAGIDFFKNSWTRANDVSPKAMAELEKGMNGSTKWGWISKTSWL
jgi:hypothetical protein